MLNTDNDNATTTATKATPNTDTNNRTTNTDRITHMNRIRMKTYDGNNTKTNYAYQHMIVGVLNIHNISSRIITRQRRPILTTTRLVVSRITLLR